jgi:hypothetical protein
MGEAKQRRKLLNYSAPQRRADIARAVRSVNLVTGGGTCFFRSLMGARALKQLGLSVELVAGRMMYRMGPGAGDLLGFIGGNDNSYHSWLEAGEDLIDFSIGDWRPLATEGYYGSARVRNWTAPPLPEFWWQPKATFGTETTILDIGVVCYQVVSQSREF